MSFYYDEELPAGFQDADFEMRELEEAGNRIASLRARGYCAHTSWVGYAVNPDTGRVFYPEQEGLTGSQVRCTDGCGQVFESDEDIHYAAPVKVDESKRDRV